MQAGSRPAPTRSEHKRTLVNFFRFGIELRNIKRATGDAVLAADAMVLMKIDDAIGVLHDGSVGGAGAQAAWIGAMQAAVFAHQPTESSVVGDVLIEADQVVIIPFQIRHGLVGVIENGFTKRIAVPFEAGDFAGFATDAGGDVDQFGDLIIARGVEAGNRPGVVRRWL